MTNPASDYSSDALDFLSDYKKSAQANAKSDKAAQVIQEFGQDYERAYQLWNTYYACAYKDLSYALSNQWSLEELSYLNNQRRSSFTFNKLMRAINMVDGYQRKNRLSTTIAPIEDASQETATIFTDVIQFIMQSTGGYETISNGFRGALTTGLAFVSPYMDYRDDPVSGDVKFHLDAWNAVTLDPFFSKKDLSDCSFVARRKFLSRPEVISMLPEQEDRIMALPWGARDDKFTYLPFARQSGTQKLLNYTEYWKRRWTIKDVLVDMQTGETRPWNGDKRRLALYQQAFPQLRVIKKPVQSVDLGIIVEGELLHYDKDPSGLDDYPFVPFMAVWEPSYDLFEWKIQSLIRVSMDAQTERNKRRSKMVDIIDSQLNSGWKAKKSAVTNPTSLYKSGQGQVVWMNDNAQMTDAERLNAPTIDPSLFQLESEFDNDIMEGMGINPELFGMSENEKIETAGILSKMRQAAGLVTLQPIFDGLRESQRLLGEKTLKLVQLNYTPEKIRLITKKEPTPEFYSQVFARYNVVVEEGILTDTQRQSQFAQYIALKAMGVQVPDSEIIKNSTLHDKKPLEEMIAAQAEAAQKAEQMQIDLAMQQQATVTKSIDAKAFSDQSLGAERLAKVQLDQALNAERISRAEEDRTAGVLNLIKAVKELESIDIAQLQAKLQILREIESGQSAETAVP